jgi:hypothetical protein
MAGSTQNSSETEMPIEPPAQAVSAEELAKSDLWIFREGRREFSGSQFLHELQQRLAANDAVVDCLIQAGELETAMADIAGPSAGTAAELTDALARQFCNSTVSLGGPEHSHDWTDAPEQIARRIVAPERLSISPPEGFTYYALHPLDFARLALQISDLSAEFAVIGIRSIGTTLSAVLAATLQGIGKKAERITLRPSGHPYARVTEFSTEQKRWIAARNLHAAQFVLVDEGPGRSGSTFLSVAEALMREGVLPAHITILGSRAFDPASLCAQHAAERWRQFRFLSATSSMSERFRTWTYVGGGDWRSYYSGPEENWPESWTQMERFKVLSPDRREFVKFEGMGRIGHEVKERAYALASAGFSADVWDAGDGFLAYAALSGRPLSTRDMSAELLERMARYCAFRVAAFRDSRSMNGELEQMLTFNIHQEFGRELKLEPGVLASDQQVIVDGRMQPYEWIATAAGTILKTDAVSHGDNHFFPGPCGIAWDLAGAIVEWDLSKDEREFLVESFRKFSGSNAAQNLTTFMLAYSVFRMGFCKMARSTVRGSNEEIRLNTAYYRYRGKAAELLDIARVSAAA